MRPRVDRESLPSVVTSGDTVGELDALVCAALADGAVELAEVTVRVLHALPAEYAATGRIADALASITRVLSEHERPWTAVVDSLEIEDWTVSAKGGPL